MKFFAALKNAEFAAKAFAEAGLDLENLAAAGDVSAIKALVESAKPSVDVAKIEADAAVVKQENATLNEALASAKADNEALVAKLADSSAKAEVSEKKVAIKAREVLAKAGLGEPINAAPNADVTKPEAKGVKSISWSEYQAMKPGARARFFRDGGKLTDSPV